MIFSSYSFIFIFLPVVFTGYWLTAKFTKATFSKLWLIAASLVFYAQGSLLFLPILVGTLVFNYIIVFFMDRPNTRKPLSRLLLCVALAENLGLLFIFKYYNFFIENVNRVFRTGFIHKSLILPLGISFYTFLIIWYIVDVYKKKSRRSNFLDYSVFVTFFPHLIVGPISRHDEFTGQLRGEECRKLNSGNIILGITLFSIGCAKKILIADPLIEHAQNFYNVIGSGNFFESWGGVITYTFAYYFDFSGYCDMAVGLGLFFNISLPINFDSPYKSKNFADFWRKWNITISQFFSQHIFSNIFHFGNPFRKLILATLITFLVSGVWHGAGWTFIFWGIANGILVCIANIMTIRRVKLPAGLSWALTFFFVLLVRVLFDSNHMTQAITIYRDLFDLRPMFTETAAFFSSGLRYILDNLYVVILTLAGAGICFFAPNTRKISENFQPKWYYAVGSGAMLVTSLFLMGTVSNFLYFQF